MEDEYLHRNHPQQKKTPAMAQSKKQGRPLEASQKYSNTCLKKDTRKDVSRECNYAVVGPMGSHATSSIHGLAKTGKLHMEDIEGRDSRDVLQLMTVQDASWVVVV